LSLPLAGSKPPSPLAVSLADKYDMRLSPDGRAMAFVAFVAGRTSLYVSALPAAGGTVRVAPGVSSPARWSRDGRELFYVSADGRMTTVRVRTELLDSFLDGVGAEGKR